jgi:PKD repeat protein
MKTKLFTALVALALLFGCSDEDTTTPDAQACFDFSPQKNLTAGDEITFTNCSENATSFAWDFGDGDISTEENPVHNYETEGDFTVKLVAANESSVDTISKDVSVIVNNHITYDNENYIIPNGYYVHDSEDESNSFAYWLVFCNSDSYNAVLDEDMFSVTPYIRMDYIVSNDSLTLADGKYYYAGPGSSNEGNEFTFIDGVFAIDENSYESITSGYFESTKIDETTYKIEFNFNGGSITGSFEDEFIFQN